VSLVKDDLKKGLLDMMSTAQDQNWSKEQVADAMATAIDSYVRAGTVTGVVVTIADGTPATQSNSVSLT